MTLLINKAKVSALLQVAIGIEDADFNKFIEEAQKFDFKPLVCEEFFFDILKNKAEEPYLKLINGGSYEYNDKDYEFDGIAGVLAYFTYARFYLNSPTVSTSHGIVEKTTPYSKPVDLEERRNTYYKKQKEANVLMADVVKYIDRNIEFFPSFNCNSLCGSSKQNKSFTTTVIQ